MSLKQKYTWQDFLKDNPEFKEKKIKRMSSEGQKAFKSAFKIKIKEYLADKEKAIEGFIEKTKPARQKIEEQLKQIQKKKDWARAKIYQRKVGKKDAAIARLVKTKDKLAQKRKTI